MTDLFVRCDMFYLFSNTTRFFGKHVRKVNHVNFLFHRFPNQEAPKDDKHFISQQLFNRIRVLVLAWQCSNPVFDTLQNCKPVLFDSVLDHSQGRRDVCKGWSNRIISIPCHTNEVNHLP